MKHNQPYNQINVRQRVIPFARKVLPTSITAALLTTAIGFLSPTTFAQTNSAQTSQASDDQIEFVEVTGIRYSQRSALDRKKEMGTMSDSLVAEDIGAFPDKNIAEALQRIPGIQLSRDNGEGATVSIRGVDPDLLRVEMNNVGAMGMGGSRAVDFRDMASELVKSLDVIKGSEARLTEGGIGGTIQVNTRKPNEFKENFLSASVEGQYNDIIGDVMPKFNVTGVYKPTDRLGVLVNVTGSDKTTILHAVRNTEWNRLADYDNSPEKTAVDSKYASVTNASDCATYSVAADRTACQKQWWDFSPQTPRYGSWERAEKRISANTMIDYQFTDNLNAYVGYTYNKRDKTAHDTNIQLDTSNANRFVPGTTVVDDKHNLIGFEAAHTANVTNRTLNFAWDQISEMIETGFEFKSDNIDVTGLIASSKADQDIDSREANIDAKNLRGITVNLNQQGLPDIDFSNAYFYTAATPNDQSNKFELNDLANYNNRTRFKYNPLTDKTTEDMGKLDVVFRPDSEFFKSFRVGIQSTKQGFVNTNQEFNIIRDQGVAYNGSVWTQQDHANVVAGNIEYLSGFFKGHDLDVYAPNGYATLNTDGFIDALRAATNENQTRRDIDQKVGNYDVEVETFAGYIQADFATEVGGMPLYGNVGVRSVTTDTAANGDVNIRVMYDENGPVIDPVSGLYLDGVWAVDETDHPEYFKGRKTVDGDYNDTLPSLNVTLGLIPQTLELYVGAAKVMARPRIADINVNASCNLYRNKLAEVDGRPSTCSSGNPRLEPFRATQTDIALTWYPDENSIVSAVYFTKDITSWTLDRDVSYDVDFFGDGRLWDVTQKVNGEGVKVKGVELQASTAFTWLPGFWSGFGGSANYTYLESKDVGLYNQLTGAELPFPSQSKHSYNLTAFYETDVWSARMAYNYRDDFLSNPADRSGNPVFTEAAGYLDGKFSYDFGNNFKLHFDARNLTGEVKATNSGSGRLASYDWSGREYSLGVSWKM